MIVILEQWMRTREKDATVIEWQVAAFSRGVREGADAGVSNVDGTRIGAALKIGSAEANNQCVETSARRWRRRWATAIAQGLVW